LRKKGNFFRRKLAKNEKDCYHNIDPCVPCGLTHIMIPLGGLRRGSSTKYGIDIALCPGRIDHHFNPICAYFITAHYWKGVALSAWEAWPLFSRKNNKIIPLKINCVNYPILTHEALQAVYISFSQMVLFEQTNCIKYVFLM
jgi:hypothetical protein